MRDFFVVYEAHKLLIPFSHILNSPSGYETGRIMDSTDAKLSEFWGSK